MAEAPRRERRTAPGTVAGVAASSHDGWLAQDRDPPRVERLMREEGLQGAFLRRRWRTASTRQDPREEPAPDLVNRDFTAPGPDRLWVADATPIPCGQGAFWLAAVRDAFSNRIVGWRCSDRCDTDLIVGALEYAIWIYDVRDGQVIHHSDRGSNYTSMRFAHGLDDHGILPPMGSVGDSYDNALTAWHARQLVQHDPPTPDNAGVDPTPAR
jgi:putative transposase